jgi:hypothetical protein
LFISASCYRFDEHCSVFLLHEVILQRGLAAEVILQRGLAAWRHTAATVGRKPLDRRVTTKVEARAYASRSTILAQRT